MSFLLLVAQGLDKRILKSQCSTGTWDWDEILRIHATNFLGYTRRASAAQLRINIRTRSRVKSIAHPVLTIPYVWRVTREYINDGLKQGLKKKKILLSILGIQEIKGHNIVNIYKMMFYPLKAPGGLLWAQALAPWARGAVVGIAAWRCTLVCLGFRLQLMDGLRWGQAVPTSWQSDRVGPGRGIWPWHTLT